MHLNIGFNEADAGHIRATPPRDFEQGMGYVGARDPAIRCHRTGKLQRRVTCAAADIQDPLTGFRSKGGHGGLTQRCQLAVERGLQFDPCWAGPLVPVGCLLSVGPFSHEIGLVTSLSQSRTSVSTSGPITSRTWAW